MLIINKFTSRSAIAAACALLIGWSIFCAASLAWNHYHFEKDQFKILLNVAKANARKDLIYKEWLGNLGGVYSSPKNIPDTYKTLQSIKKNNLTTLTGKELTFINPAFMLAQVQKKPHSANVFFGKIKTINTMMPGNKPDQWEAEALQVLSSGKSEYFTIVENDKHQYLKLMIPIHADDACLKSWPASGIKLGDLVGGMTVTMPVDYFADEFTSGQFNWAGHSLLWLLGLLGISLSTRLFQKEYLARSNAEREKEVFQLQNELLLASAGEGIFAIDTKGNYTFVNPATAELLGYSVDELMGENNHTLCHHTKQDGTHYLEVECPIYAAFTHGEIFEASTETFWKKDGSSFPVQFTSRPLIQNNKITGAVVTFSDITRQKKSETDLRDSRERFKAIFTQAAVGIALIDLSGQYLQVNKKLCQILGYDEEALKTMIFQDLTHQADIPVDLRDISLLLAGEIDFLNKEKRYIHKNGSIIIADISISLVRGEDGKPLYFISAINDITQRKKAQKEQQSLQKQLIQSQKMEIVGRLAGGIAHDFNNLLTVILGYSDEALEKTTPDSELFEDFTLVKEAGEKAAGLTRQLLAFSRKQIMKMESVDINKLLGNMTKMLKRLLGETIQLDVNILTQSNIWADSGQVEQVVMNLVVNARDAISSGGTITITTEDICIEPGDTDDKELKPGNYVQLSVRDTGSGMSEETMGKIFEPFFTSKESGKGTGLGLATVHGIVKQFDGYINIDSELGKGSTFNLLLPVAKKQILVKSQTTSLVPLEGKELILLVEDNHLIRKMIEKILIKSGYRTLHAGDAEEALLVAESSKEKIDLLLTDIVLPKTNGKVLADKIKKLSPETKILFMSGYMSETVSKTGLAVSDKNFIQKPFTQLSLKEKLRSVLSHPLET